MKALAKDVISGAAVKAGLDAEKIYDAVESDNLTIKRPYLTIQFLPETYTRTGRKLGVKRNDAEIIRKREFYELELNVAVQVLAEDEMWLSDFAYTFIRALPGGQNDSRGNWVKIRAEKAEFSRPPDKRVGNAVIEVFKKRDQLFDLTFTGRITSEEYEALIREYNINTYWRGHDKN